jgi:tetratricopeptide (TPR) repeat protein
MARLRSANDGRIPAALALLSLAALVVLLLVVVGRPLATDDLWWHLALGERYASEGVQLDSDPLLQTATEAPAAASWLFDVAAHGVACSVGFQGLRLLHVGLVAAILVLTHSLFRRAWPSTPAACLASAFWISISWYRLVQLRPELATILATLILYRLLLEQRGPPSWRRVGGAVALLLVWANVHAAFVIGPLLLVAALAGTGLWALLDRTIAVRSGATARTSPAISGTALALGAALVLGTAAAWLNPRGLDQLIAFSTSAGSPRLWSVGDEWAQFDPFAWRGVSTRLSWLSWAATDLLFLGVPVAAARNAWQLLRHPSRQRLAALDPLLLALATASLVAVLVAVRFQWLMVFPLLYLLRTGRTRAAAHRGGPVHATSWALAATCTLLALGAASLGGLRPAALGVPSQPSRYLTTPVDTSKYYSHAVWFLSDAGVEGRLFNNYYMGGYVGYWLAPGLRAFVNGTLNFPEAVAEDYAAIMARRGARPGEGLLDVLDRNAIDVFLGVGLPLQRDARGPPRYTSAHLEHATGWRLVFRSLRSAVYLRDVERNRENLDRIAAWYEAQGVPFDPVHGFDAATVLRARPDWAAAHGLVPAAYPRIRAAAARASDRALGLRALNRLGDLYAALGLYPEQLAVDAEASKRAPRAPGPRRRSVFASMRMGRLEQALAQAEALVEVAPSDPRSRTFLETVRRAIALRREQTESGASVPPGAALSEPSLRLPLFTADEARNLMQGIASPNAREHGHREPISRPGDSRGARR